MKRRPLLLWLLAWSGWLWLGFGLHRELPRRLGPTVCRLPIASGSSSLGFVGETDYFAKRMWNERLDLPELVVFDARSGSRVSEGPMPISQTAGVIFANGFLFGGRLEEPASKVLYAVDVLKQKWRPIAQGPLRMLVVHPAKPWIAIAEGLDYYKPTRVSVVDYESGSEIFERSLEGGASVSSRPFFLPQRNAVAVPLQVPGPSKWQSRPKLEIWRLDQPAVLEETLDGIEIRHFSQSKNGRVVVYADRTDSSGRRGNVYDFYEKRFYSSASPAEGNRLGGGGVFKPVISPNGTTVLSHSPKPVEHGAQDWAWPTLYEVRTGRILWQAGLHDGVAFTGDGGNEFLVKEVWHSHWKWMLPNLKWETFANRSLDDGRLLFRTQGSVRIHPALCNADRTLAVLDDGSVHRLPLAVYRPILALCQTILALPVVALWAVLRWRRWRRLRSASA